MKKATINSAAPKRTAVIDIGSTAVRLQIAHLVQGRVVTELFTRVPLALGGNMADGRQKITAPAHHRLTAVLTGMRHLIRGMKPCGYRIAATAAVRNAANQRQIIEAIYRDTGMRIRVLGGRQEAALIGCYVASHFPAAAAVVNIDIGGGSTDCALLIDGGLVSAASFALGIARADGGTESEKIRCARWLTKHCPADAVVVSSGGSAAQLQHCCGAITQRRLLRWRRQVKDLSIADISVNYRMLPDQAAHAMAALDIYLLILQQGIKQIVAVRGGLSESLIWRQLQ